MKFKALTDIILPSGEKLRKGDEVAGEALDELTLAQIETVLEMVLDDRDNGRAEQPKTKKARR